MRWAEVEEATPRSLAGARMAVCGLLAAQLSLMNSWAIGRLPVATMHPPGAMEYLGWKFYDRLITPGGMLALQVALIGSLALAASGVLARLTMPLAALLYVLYEGVLRSFGHFNHDEMPAVWILFILAMSPGCGRGDPTLPGPAYGYPVFLCRAVVAWSYFTAGLLKVVLGGRAYFTTDSLLTLMAHNSLGNLHDTQFKVAFWLADHRPLVLPGLLAVMSWELLFPVTLFWRRARLPMLALGVAFHLGCTLAMNITFPVEMLMYAVFVDWGRVGPGARRLAPARGIA